MEKDMKISKEDVLRVAELAYLDLTPAEVETLQGQLDGVLTYIDKLNTLDVANVEPMEQGLLKQPEGAANAHPELREDVLRPCDIGDAVLSGAPDSAKPFFRVPRVIER
jgi:aspartyl-tRNA(Asn)/glutamyl-tRNA(Gln) amidotransferase subunit C